MSASEDVKTLFRRFGGEPEGYQEVVRERQAVQSLGRWAMLGQVHLDQIQSAPAVHRAFQIGTSRPIAEDLRRDAAFAAAHSPVVSVAAVPAAVVVPVPAPPIFEAAPEVTPSPAAVLPVVAVSPAVVADPAPPVEAMRLDTPQVAQTITQAPAPTIAAPQNVDLVPPPATRAKAQAIVPEALAQSVPTGSHSLSGLFGRLSVPQPQNPKPGVLRRKFNK